MRNVLLLVHDDSGEKARLEAALDLARALSGHLTCLNVLQTARIIPDIYSAGGDILLLAEAREREAANRQEVEARLARENMSWDWEEAIGDISSLLARRIDLSDIIVLNTELASYAQPQMRSIVSDVVMRSGRPVLAVPEAARRFDAGGHAVVAWNGSSAVATMLRWVTPLLAVASVVTILEVGQEMGAKAGPTAAEAVTYLARHGITSGIDRRPAAGSVAATIMQAALDLGAAYCALGAYSHPRFIEGIFGGVTRDLLRQSPVPLILAH